jgi:two-component system CheB/CheR fusion protein
MTSPNEFNSDFNFIEALFKNARQNAALLMQTDGTVSAINNAFTDHFGYQEKDIVGKNGMILFTEEDQRKGLPEKELQNVLLTGQANDNNYLVNKNQQLTWVSGESILVKNNEGQSIILKILQNIHEQKTSSIAINNLNTLNESILSTIKDVVIVLDNNLNIIKVNDAFLSLFHEVRGDIKNLSLIGFLKQSENNKRLLKKLQTSIEAKTGFSNQEIELDVPDGSKKFFEITCTPLLNSDNRNLLLTIHDITVSKELEKEREDIIGFVTHELRNPLSNLMLSNDIMKEAVKKNNTPLISNMLSRFESSVERMNKMVAGLYESTKVNAGQFFLEKTEFNFDEMVKEAVETIALLHPSYNIIVKGNAEFTIVADRYRLIQVITNYLSNAIKYSQDKEITLTVTHDSDSVTVAVKDNGSGISKEHLPYVFERFFRIKKTRNIEGIGLGLYLCSRIIHAHKGHLWAESEINKGSTFYFSIPLRPEIV